MKGQKVLFSSLSDEWNTPKSLFDKLNREFNFDSDPCPSKKKLKKGIINGVWLKRVFVNPLTQKLKIGFFKDIFMDNIIMLL